MAEYVIVYACVGACMCCFSVPYIPCNYNLDHNTVSSFSLQVVDESLCGNMGKSLSIYGKEKSSEWA